MLKATYFPYRLVFRFDAGTSRGVLKEKTSWFIKIWRKDEPEVYGLGECGPLPGLSPDHKPFLEKEIRKALEVVTGWDDVPPRKKAGEVVRALVPSYLPALAFAMETALLDLASGGRRQIVENDFVRGRKQIPINGLIWMGEKEFMLQQIREKLDEGYDCIKIKVGALDLKTELALLKYIRTQYPAGTVTLRLDANGAFQPEKALEILEKFAVYDIHSIEQPIRAGLWREMRRLCRDSPIPIALDEELIGISGSRQQLKLLKDIKPQYVVLKPTLLGGLSATGGWVKHAESSGIDWWITSALESNIGLNAIAQYTADFQTSLHQGLGTGQLYHNNVPGPLYILKGHLGCDPAKGWDMATLAV